MAVVFDKEHILKNCQIIWPGYNWDASTVNKDTNGVYGFQKLPPAGASGTCKCSTGYKITYGLWPTWMHPQEKGGVC